MPDPIIVNSRSLEKTFDEAAPMYDPNGFFKVHGQRLVELLQIRIGARVLDIAVGIGAVLLPSARKAGPSGRVTGIDISANMLKRTKQLALAEDLDNIDLLQMDGGQLQFTDASFDIVTCGFGVFFLPATGLDEMYRVCKPGGILGLTVFGKTVVPEKSCGEVFNDLTKEYGIEVKYSMPLPAYFRLEEIQSLLTSHGFKNINTVQETEETVYGDPEDCWKVVLSAGNRSVVMNMDESTRIRFKSELFDRLRLIIKPDGLHHLSSVIYVTAIKSGNTGEHI
jgi:ubiquinone/menaquinone biosynthesis C-methylase UbiE